MNNSDDQSSDYTYYESNGRVHCEPSEEDIAYVNRGAGKAFMTILPVISMSLVMIIGALRVEDSSLVTIFSTMGFIILGISITAFPMIKDMEEDKRIKEVMDRYRWEYCRLHRG